MNGISMAATDRYALSALEWAWKLIKACTIIGGGIALILTDLYTGGIYYGAIFSFTEGPQFVQENGPWLVSLGTSALQIFVFQWIASFQRANLPKTPIAWIAFIGVGTVTVVDLLADVGGATIMMYGDQYVSRLFPNTIEMKWIIGMVIVGCISVFTEPIMGYFVSNHKPKLGE